MPFSVFTYFTETVTLLVVETTRHYHCCKDSLDVGPSPKPDVSKMFVFLAIITQMGQFYIPFCSNMMRWNRYVYILQFLVFADNRNGVDRIEDNYNRLCKIQDMCEILIRISSKFYNPSENLPTDKMIVLFKGRVIFRQYIPRKHKCFDIKIYKLCGLSGYT
jgi:hypothetical protein